MKIITKSLVISLVLINVAVAQNEDLGAISAEIDTSTINTIDQTNSSASTPATANCNCAITDPVKTSNWDKSIAFGFNKTQGNSDTNLLTGSANFIYSGDENEFAFKANGSRGEADDERNQEDVLIGADYRRILAERWYVGYGKEVLYDDIADIDYRINLKPTLGYYLLKQENSSFALEVSPGYIFDKVGGIKDNYFAPRIANRFDWKITETARVFQSAEYIFDIDDSNNYLANGEAGIEASIGPNLALVYSVRDNYRNIPAAGNKRNDLEILTTLKINF